jgi:hypothetical protein
MSADYSPEEIAAARAAVLATLPYDATGELTPGLVEDEARRRRQVAAR